MLSEATRITVASCHMLGDVHTHHVSHPSLQLRFYSDNSSILAANVKVASRSCAGAVKSAYQDHGITKGVHHQLLCSSTAELHTHSQAEQRMARSLKQMLLYPFSCDSPGKNWPIPLQELHVGGHSSRRAYCSLPRAPACSRYI